MLIAGFTAISVDNAAGGVTETGVSVIAPINAATVKGSTGFSAKVVSDSLELRSLNGFTLLAGERPLVGIEIKTGIGTAGPVSLTLQTNEIAYWAMLLAGRTPSIRRITESGTEQRFEPEIEVIGKSAFFTFTSPGFSVFVLVSSEPIPTLTPTPTPLPTPVPSPASAVEPTATPTPVPVATVRPPQPALTPEPTATVAPPRPTPTPAPALAAPPTIPTPTPPSTPVVAVVTGRGGGLSGGAIVGIVVGGIGAAGAAGLYIWRRIIPR